jgi:tRNA 2-selenouridine synthase
MSSPRPVGIDQLAEFDVLIDARSPAEFALDHIPGAINCPVLDDDERRIVGTIYKQEGAFEARRIGAGLVAANLARHLRDRFAEQPHGWRPLIYCWRGGLRSGSMTQWLRLVGWNAQQLAGGYKRWRSHVIACIDRLSPQMDLRVLCGPTGSAKTRVLQALGEAGAQVLDLEACADHKGSVLGDVPGVLQPSQKAFETRVATVLQGLDLSRPVYVEAESRKIGRIALPTVLLMALRAGRCIKIVASPAARLDYLLRDYAYLGADGEALATTLGQLHGLQSNETLARWQGWARSGDLAALFAELMALHYDPLYSRSQHGDFVHWKTAREVEAPTLAEAALPALARRILALDAAG